MYYRKRNKGLKFTAIPKFYQDPELSDKGLEIDESTETCREKQNSVSFISVIQLGIYCQVIIFEIQFS